MHPKFLLRSTDTKQLFIILLKTSTWSRAFSVAPPTLWNYLPSVIRTAKTMTISPETIKNSSILSGVSTTAPRWTSDFTRNWNNVGLTLAQRRGRWTNVKTKIDPTSCFCWVVDDYMLLLWTRHWLWIGLVRLWDLFIRGVRRVRTSKIDWFIDWSFANEVYMLSESNKYRQRNQLMLKLCDWETFLKNNWTFFMWYFRLLGPLYGRVEMEWTLCC